MRQANGNTPTAGPHIKKGWDSLVLFGRPLREKMRPMLNQQLAFRAWDQDVRSNLKL
jgi:hypothetical protein